MGRSAFSLCDETLPRLVALALVVSERKPGECLLVIDASPFFVAALFTFGRTERALSGKEAGR